MMTKTIKISEKNHYILSEFASKNETFDDVISFLINYYVKQEEFSDKQAKFYNDAIVKFENGNLENVTKLTLSELERRISSLEKEIQK